jgi:hypothetical protein
VGLLVVVELTSGVLQGYYTPVYSDIGDALHVADGDLNWFEAAQLHLLGAARPAARPARRRGRAPQRAAALDRRHGGRLLGDGVRARLQRPS